MEGPKNEESALEESVRPWLGPVARTGYAAKGVVYVIIGFLAAAAGWQGKNEDPDSRGALQTLLEQPFGQLLLAVVILGLAAYSIWRLLQTFLDPEHKGTDFKGLVLRGYYLVSAVAHAFLVWSGVEMLLGTSPENASSSIDQRTAEVMAQPFGRWLIGLAGLAVIGGAIYQLVRAVKASFVKHLRLERVSETVGRWIVRVGRFGLAARGLLFAITGSALVYAGFTFRPSEAKGLAESLSTLRDQPYGFWLLQAVALGLLAYGVHQLVKARLREIEA